MMKLVLIRVIIRRKKIIIIVMKSEMSQFFWDNICLQMIRLLWDGRNIYV